MEHCCSNNKVNDLHIMYVWPSYYRRLWIGIHVDFIQFVKRLKYYRKCWNKVHFNTATAMYSCLFCVVWGYFGPFKVARYSFLKCRKCKFETQKYVHKYFGIRIKVDVMQTKTSWESKAVTKYRNNVVATTTIMFQNGWKLPFNLI